MTASILHRYHFNSNLKRMSALVRVTERGGGAAVTSATGGSGEALLAVTKGAPEVVKQLLGRCQCQPVPPATSTAAS